MHHQVGRTPIPPLHGAPMAAIDRIQDEIFAHFQPDSLGPWKRAAWDSERFRTAPTTCRRLCGKLRQATGRGDSSVVYYWHIGDRPLQRTTIAIGNNADLLSQLLVCAGPRRLDNLGCVPSWLVEIG
jgi:hypothetical protein